MDFTSIYKKLHLKSLESSEIYLNFPILFFTKMAYFQCDIIAFFTNSNYYISVIQTFNELIFTLKNRIFTDNFVFNWDNEYTLGTRQLKDRFHYSFHE